MSSHARRGHGVGATGFFLRRVANRIRIVGKDLADTAAKTKDSLTPASVEERRNQLRVYYEGYEDYVEMLCDAAQYGPSPRLDEKYQAKRTWLATGYQELKPLLGAFLRPDEKDPFEALFSAPTVLEFLESDDGETIDRISRAREALNLYAEHLRHLAERSR